MKINIPTMRRGNAAMAIPSLSHTIGNVTFKFTKMFKEMFGKKFFKYVHVNSRMAYTEFVKNNGREFIHKNKPILSVNPSYELDNDDIFLYNSLLVSNVYGQNYGVGGQNLFPFIVDRKIGSVLYYMMDRIRVNFGCAIILDTYQEQMNAYAAMLYMYIPNQIYYMRTAIEIHIPHQLIQMLSIDTGIPIYDEHGSVEKFLRYLNANSCKPVTFQMKTSSGQEEFFMYYPLNIEYVFSDISISDLEKKGFVSNSATITFQMTAELNCVQAFTYVAPPNVKSALCSEEFRADIVVPDFKGSQLIVPIFSYENMFEDRDKDGWKYFTSRLYKVESDKEPDVFDISSIFESTNIKDIVEYHNKYGLDNHLVMSVDVFDGIGNQLEEGKDYKFDYENLTLTTINVNTYMTYRFVIYVNNEYINDLMVKLHPEEFLYSKDK